MTRIDEINQFMLDAFKENGLEDTPTNRIDFLYGLRDAWKEDPSTSFEKTLYIISIHMEIALLQRIVRRPSE